MNNMLFWRERVQKYGHTGWCYPCTYGFDQPLRIKVVKELIGRYAQHKETLLDFGCGTGDFSGALKNDFCQITAYDPCVDVLEKAKDELKDTKNISFVDNFNSLKEIGMSYDVVLSITVLQHIMLDQELHNNLRFLYQEMKQNGIFVIMESFVSNIESNYERNWTYQDFKSMMEKAGFTLLQGYNFYNPMDDNDIFNQYFTLPEVVQLRKQKNMTDQEKIVEYQKIAARYIDNPYDFLYPFTADDGSKFFVYSKN